MFINNFHINSSSTPYIIAELSGNHNGSIENAKLLIKMAKESGAHAVKIQTYDADAMTINCDKSDFIISGGLWHGWKLYDLYEKAHTPYEWHSELFNYANNIGITLFSSPFDENAVDLLENLNTPAYKVASFEITDLGLIRYIARTGKPMLISTGMSTDDEISEALEAARSGGCNSILLFHCISNYPTPISESNLLQIRNLHKKFGTLVGLSDHSLGTTAAITAVALGARAIEKHFTLSRANDGPDIAFSIVPSELKILAEETANAWKSIGESNFNRSQAELKNLAFRRSIYFINDIKKGDKIKRSDIKKIRPGFGLEPKYFEAIIGKLVTRDVYRGDPVSWNSIGDN